MALDNFATTTADQLATASDLVLTDKVLVSRGAGPLEAAPVQLLRDLVEDAGGEAAIEAAQSASEALASKTAAQAAAVQAAQAVASVDDTMDLALAGVNATLADVVTGVVAGSAVFAASYAVLSANNAPALNTFGIVPTDADLTKRGIYIKSAAAGSPGWTLTTIPLASALVATLQAAIDSEIANRMAAFGGASLIAMPADADIKAAIVDAEMRMLIGFADSLDVIIPRMLNFDTGDDRYGPDFLWGLLGNSYVDENGVTCWPWWFYARKDGTCSIKIHPDSFLEAEAATYIDPSVVIALGARGQVHEVRALSDGLYSYKSTQDGFTLPYLCWQHGSVHIVANERVMEMRPRYGQSWETANMIETVPPFDKTGEKFGSFTFKSVFGGPLQYVGVPSQIPLIVDLTPLDRVGVAIGSVAATTVNRLRRDLGYQIRPILSFSAAYPGFTWAQLQPGSDPWTALVGYVAAANSLAKSYGFKPSWRWFGFTEACAGSRVDPVDCAAALTTLMGNVDALNLPDTGQMNFGMDVTPAVSEDTTPYEQSWQQIAFARTNANGRTWMVGPRYAYPYVDNIHYTRYGYAKIGEIHGLCETAVLDAKVNWKPLQILKPGGVADITVAGSLITIKTNTPWLAEGGLVIDTASIEAAPNFGFQVKVGGAFRAITSVTVAGTTIQILLPAPIPEGTSYEPSYCAYGPGSVAGRHSGVWGNVKMKGPASRHFVNETIDHWLMPFKETKVA